MVHDVFDTATLGPVRLRNRIIKAATFEGRTPDGQVTDELINYHLDVARGGAGLTTVAYLSVAPEGRTHGGQIVVGPETLPGLARLATAIHEEGAAVAGQLGHAGPVANGRSNGVRALSASGMPSPLSMQWVRSATERDLARITRQYAESAATLVRAGFDVLEIHMAHSYLISSFLAPALNRRADKWGGALANRARLARQVAAAVRDEVGDSAAIIAKVSVSDGFRGGLDTGEAIEFAGMLEADQALDALELSAGSSLMNPMYLFRGEVPRREFAATMPLPVRLGLRVAGRRFLREYPFEEAYLLDKALRFREALSMPLILLGGINLKKTMQRAMELGFSHVAMARALLREPDLINRMRSEHIAEGACIHCNRCMPTIYGIGGTYCPVITDAAAGA